MEYHPVTGLIMFALVFFQPVLGWVHHFCFKKYQRRTVWSHAHIWLGRILITLGVINGGLGLLMTEGYQAGIKKGEIVYGVVAGTIWIVYVAVAAFAEVKKGQTSMLQGKNTPSDSGSEYERKTQMEYYDAMKGTGSV